MSAFKETIVDIGIVVLAWIIGVICEILEFMFSWKGAVFLGFLIIVSSLNEVNRNLRALRYRDN